jgi:hypothetical protein
MLWEEIFFETYPGEVSPFFGESFSTFFVRVEWHYIFLYFLKISKKRMRIVSKKNCFSKNNSVLSWQKYYLGILTVAILLPPSIFSTFSSHAVIFFDSPPSYHPIFSFIHFKQRFQVCLAFSNCIAVNMFFHSVCSSAIKKYSPPQDTFFWFNHSLQFLSFFGKRFTIFFWNPIFAEHIQLSFTMDWFQRLSYNTKSVNLLHLVFLLSWSRII